VTDWAFAERTAAEQKSAAARRAGLWVTPADAPAERDADQLAEAAMRVMRSPGAVSHAPVSQRVQRSANVIHRKIAFTSKTFINKTSWTAKANGFMGDKSTFAQIKEALDEYHKTPDPVNELFMLRAIDALCTSWLKEHTDDKDKGQRTETQQLQAQLGPEITRLEATMATALPDTDNYLQQRYMGRMQDSRTGGIMKFDFLTNIGLGTADWMKAVAEGGALPGTVRNLPGIDAKNTTLSATKHAHGLTDAEATAIGVYSAQDYRYINPAVANNPGWMKGNLKAKDLGVKDQTVAANLAKDGPVTDITAASAGIEGLEHEKVLLQALKKLPAAGGQAFRGRGMSPDEVKALKKPSATWREDAFASTSRRRDKADEFAAKEGAKPGNEGVVFVYNLRNGRDIAAFSLADEAEVLLLPKAAFRVTKTSTEKINKTEVTVIYADQVA
jgi:hypothetical protein